MSTRKPILIANWKLNHSKSSAANFFMKLLAGLKNFRYWEQKVDLVIAPVATLLDFAAQELKNSGVSIAAQDVFYESQGAYTGEYSSEHLKDLGVSFSIVGHSERRRLFYESDQDAGKKAQACLRAHVTPICCVGESLAEREEGIMHDVLRRQVKAFADNLSDQAHDIILAYEPVWAIGTGRCAQAQEAEEAHGFIRDLWGHLKGKQAASAIRIVYGGSVTPQNIAELVSMPNIDGALVGGASLQVESFLAMVEKLPNLNS
jgi:triosephosphate isomerase